MLPQKSVIEIRLKLFKLLLIHLYSNIYFKKWIKKYITNLYIYILYMYIYIDSYIYIV